MIADIKPYTAMKDSGVPWVDDVPLRALEDIRADILVLETEGLLRMEDVNCLTRPL